MQTLTKTSPVEVKKTGCICSVCEQEMDRAFHQVEFKVTGRVIFFCKDCF